MDLPAGTGRQNFHHIKTDVGISIRALLKILACRSNQTLLFIIVHRFGWGGVLAQGLDWGMAASLAAAFFTGVLMFLIIGISMRFIMSLKSDGTLNYETLKGMTGSVYISIPGNLQRGGQVTIAHPSQLLYLPAVQEGEHPLPSGTPVEVVAVTAGIVTVKPLH